MEENDRKTHRKNGGFQWNFNGISMENGDLMEFQWNFNGKWWSNGTGIGFTTLGMVQGGAPGHKLGYKPLVYNPH